MEPSEKQERSESFCYTWLDFEFYNLRSFTRRSLAVKSRRAWSQVHTWLLSGHCQRYHHQTVREILWWERVECDHVMGTVMRWGLFVEWWVFSVESYGGECGQKILVWEFYVDDFPDHSKLLENSSLRKWHWGWRRIQRLLFQQTQPSTETQGW